MNNRTLKKVWAFSFVELLASRGCGSNFGYTFQGTTRGYSSTLLYSGIIVHSRCCKWL